MLSSRRLMSGSLAIALGLLAVVAVGVARAGSGPGAGYDPAVDPVMTDSSVRVQDAGGATRQFDAIVVLVNPPGRAGNVANVYGALTYNAVQRRNENRLGIVKDIPLAGRLFAERIRRDDMTAQNRIGTAYGIDNVLLVDLRRSAGGGDQSAVQGKEVTVALQVAIKAGAKPVRELDMADWGGEPAAVVSVVNRDFSQSLDADRFVAQDRGHRFFGTPVEGGEPGRTLIPALGPWAVELGTVHRAGGRLIVAIPPSVLIRTGVVDSGRK